MARDRGQGRGGDEFEALLHRFTLLHKGTLADHLGLRMLELRRGYARAEMAVGTHLRQSWGYVHGAALVALADVTAGGGTLASIPADHAFTTVELKINFLVAERCGPLTAEAELLRQGRTLVVWEVRIRNPRRTLVAVATLTNWIVKGNRRRPNERHHPHAGRRERDGPRGTRLDAGDEGGGSAKHDRRRKAR